MLGTMGPRLLLLCACLLPLAPTGASEQVAEILSRASEDFEQAMWRHFAPVKERLTSFRLRSRIAQSAKITAAMETGSEKDRKFLAYHLLTVFPRHRDAIAVWGEDEAGRPIGPDGTPNPEVAVPQPDDPAVLALVRHFRQPSFAAVKEEVLRSAKTLNSRAKQRTVAQFYAKLVQLCRLAPKQAGPVMAFYFPGAKEVKGQPPPATRYLVPLDRFLLDQGLSAVECDKDEPARGPAPKVDARSLRFGKDATWHFPLHLANCRIEALVDAGSVLDVTLGARGGRSVALAWQGKAGSLTANGQATPLALPAGVEGGQLDVELRGPRLHATLNGLLLATVKLETPLAVTEARVRGGSKLPHLAIRYLGEPEVGTAALPPPVATDAAWKRDLDQALARPVTVAFEDQSLRDVVATLGDTTGVTFLIDPSAEALLDVPLYFDAEDMKLVDVLTWLKRMTDVDHRLTQGGVVLEWRAAK